LIDWPLGQKKNPNEDSQSVSGFGLKLECKRRTDAVKKLERDEIHLLGCSGTHCLYPTVLNLEIDALPVHRSIKEISKIEKIVAYIDTRLFVIRPTDGPGDLKRHFVGM
jgi:hypothetical protein